MKITVVSLAFLTAIFLAFLIFFISGLDAWVGILAFQIPYLCFCLIAALALGAAWLVLSKRAAVIVGLVVFVGLISPFILNEPSERILRKILIQVEAGMSESEVETLVRTAYAASDYVMPEIHRDGDRIRVSLINQQAGNCSAAYFYLANGIVVRDEFSAD